MPDPQSATDLPPAKSRAATALKLAGIAAAIGAVMVLVRYLGLAERVADALQSVAAWGAAGVLAFIAIYAVAVVGFVPGSALTLAAGFAYGVGWGSVYVSAASTLGATLAFLVGRHLARGWVARKTEGNARFAAIDRAVGDEGFKMVLLVRLLPLIPFNLLNYALGLTKVRLRDYVLGSWIGMMPGTVLYVYIGSVGRAAAGGAKKGAVDWILYGLGFAAAIAATLYITRIAKRALGEKLDADPPDEPTRKPPTP